MAIPHAAAGQAIDVRPLGDHLRQAVTTTLVKSDQLEIIRLVLPAGKELPPHRVAVSITVQCLAGLIEFHAAGRCQTPERGLMLYLDGNELHSVNAVEDSSVLVTIHITGNSLSAADVP